MGLEAVVIKQVVKVAKNTAKIEDALATMQDKLVNESLKTFDTTQINPGLLDFSVEDLVRGNIEDPNSIFTPENLCTPPPLTETQKQQSIKDVERLKAKISNTVDNIDSLKQALITVQQPLQTLEITANNLNNIITTVKGAVKVIKAIPIPTAFGMPAIAVPINVLTILSDALDGLDKLLGKAKGVVTIVSPLIRAVTGMISGTIESIDKLVNNIPGSLIMGSYIQAKVELGDSCPNVSQQDMDVIKSSVSLDIQNAVSELGDSSIPSVNILSEQDLIASLQYNAENPIVYNWFTLYLQNDPDNPFDFPSRRIWARRYFSLAYQQTGTGRLYFKQTDDGTDRYPLIGPIDLYNNSLGVQGQQEGRYSFASSVQVLVEEMKYTIDQFLIDVTSTEKFNEDPIAIADPEIQNIGGTDLDTGGSGNSQNTPLPDFILNGQNIVRPEIPSYNPNTGLVTMLGGPKEVSGSIQINKPGTRIKLESFGGINQGDFLNTILNITPPYGVGLPNQASIISRLTEVLAYNNAEEEYTFQATGSWGYLMKITSNDGGTPQSTFDLISP